MSTNLTFNFLEEKLKQAQHEAGPRYTPILDKDFPSLEIENLATALDGLSRNKHFWEKLQNVYSEFEEESESTLLKQKDRWTIQQIIDFCDEATKIIPKLEKELKRIPISTKKLSYQLPEAELKERLKEVNDLMRKGRDLTYANKPEEIDKAAKEEWDRYGSILRRFENKMYEISKLISSDSVKLFNSPKAILIGEVGTGKTHFLCDFAGKALSEKHATVLALASNINSSSGDFILALIEKLGLSYSKKEFLTELQKKAEAVGGRSLIFIDAINEADRSFWKQAITNLLKDLSAYPEIGLVISCRSPYEFICLPKKPKHNLLPLYHPGFEDIELDAQVEFFKYYSLPLSEVPFLHQEFSRPLFLKIFCESLHGKIVKGEHKQIKDFASGQKGMTSIFEDFMKAKEGELNTELDSCLSKKKGWIWDKSCLIKDIAQIMSDNSRDFIYEKELEILIAKYAKAQKHWKLIRQKILIAGVLMTAVHWENSKPVEVIKFPYQKFGDHLIVRTALKKFSIKSKKDIRKIMERWKDNQNLLEALMIELPQRKPKSELLQYYSFKELDSDLVSSFISGLYWRDFNCFNQNTIKFINIALHNFDERMTQKTLEVIFSLATKPQHPLSAKRVSKMLKRMTVVHRDLFWSEFLRSRYGGSAVYRLLHWIENKAGKLTTEYIENYLNLIQWLLTSTVRPLRDRATKSLFLLGNREPILLFSITKKSFTMNDKYIPDRLLATCYGVAMSQHTSARRGHFLKKELPSFALWLAKEVLAAEGRYATTHSLIRDYAAGIVELAVFNKSISRKWLEICRRPEIPPPSMDAGTLWRRDKEALEKDGGEWGHYPYVHMDSAKYILGRISTDDSNNSVLNDAIAKVTWKIKKIGWNEKDFEEVEREIRDSTWSNRSDKEQQKTDRYGKKYFWICYYELAGYHSFIFKNKGKHSYKSDKGKEEDIEDYTSRRDIDPSFPTGAENIQIVNKSLLGGSKDIGEWLKNGPLPNLNEYLLQNGLGSHEGEWIMLDGHIDQEDKKARKRMFVFVRGILLNKNDIARFIQAVEKVPYPGNSLIPDAEQTYYTFQGEVPWSRAYPPQRYSSTIDVPSGEHQEWFKLTDEQKRMQKLGTLSVDDLQLLLKYYQSDGDVLTEEHKNSFFLLQEKMERTDADDFSFRKVREFEHFEVEIPIFSHNWESYHSAVNKGHSVDLPTKEICEFLNLEIREGNFNLYEKSGDLATISTRAGEEMLRGENFIFMRKDLLQKYLLKKDKVLLWFIWGERLEKADGFIKDGKYSHIYAAYEHVHRQFVRSDSIIS